MIVEQIGKMRQSRRQVLCAPLCYFSSSLEAHLITGISESQDHINTPAFWCLSSMVLIDGGFINMCNVSEHLGHRVPGRVYTLCCVVMKMDGIILGAYALVASHIH